MSNFVGDVNEIFTPKCNVCIYYLGDAKCKAYERIPDKILEGELHNEINSNQIGNYIFKQEK